MHNDTPLGTIMYLKELDRQAAPKFVSVQPKAQRSSPGTTFGALMSGKGADEVKQGAGLRHSLQPLS
jgi:hypothetical protein